MARKKREMAGSETPNTDHRGDYVGYGDVFNRKEVEEAHKGWDRERERRRDGEDSHRRMRNWTRRARKWWSRIAFVADPCLSVLLCAQLGEPARTELCLLFCCDTSSNTWRPRHDYDPLSLHTRIVLKHLSTRELSWEHSKALFVERLLYAPAHLDTG